MILCLYWDIVLPVVEFPSGGVVDFIVVVVDVVVGVVVVGDWVVTING